MGTAMQNSKTSALMFLLGAFLVGGALGFLADREVNMARHGHGREDFRQRMAEELELTAPQKAAIDSLMLIRHQQIVALFKPVKPQLDSISAEARAVSDSTHEQIKRLLTPAQQIKFDAMRDAARRDLERNKKRWDSTQKPAPAP
jgi:Spy/CpxP family protein refolding chaperone